VLIGFQWQQERQLGPEFINVVNFYVKSELTDLLSQLLTDL
jgi:hypothetical protein